MKFVGRLRPVSVELANITPSRRFAADLRDRGTHGQFAECADDAERHKMGDQSKSARVGAFSDWSK